MTRSAETQTATGGRPWWSRSIDRRLITAIEACQAHVEAVHPAALRILAAPLSNEFNKPRTNMLIHRAAEQVRAFVDHDLEYQGQNKTLRQALSGPRKDNWRQLAINVAAASAGQAVTAVLAIVNSPVIELLNEDLSEANEPGREPLAPNTILATQTRAMNPAELSRSFRKSLHKPLARQLAVALTRQPPRGCLVWGAAGAGKEQLVRSSAHVLLQRGEVRNVRYLHAARLTCGRHFPAERDAVLSALLDELADQPDTLLLAEGFDLAVSGTFAGFSLLCDAIDRGVRLLATVQQEELLKELGGAPSLARRLLPVEVPAPGRRETLRALEEYARNCGCDVTPAALLAAVQISERQQGTQPSAAIDLLSAAVAEAAWRTNKQITPDDLTSVLNPQWPE